jgi:hypothetical protein
MVVMRLLPIASSNDDITAQVKVVFRLRHANSGNR